jgi:hypothetical protein
MFNFATAVATAVAASAGWVLRPAAILRRCRPVKLRLAYGRLRQYQRKALALNLIGQHCPEQLADVGVDDDWLETFRALLAGIEALEWFEIDWATLDEYYNLAQQCGIEDDDQIEPDGVSVLANYLYQIPVKTYGFADEEGLAYESFPEMALLAGLLGRHQLDVDMLVESELWDNMEDVILDASDVQARLETHDFTQYKPPLCWLPEMARIAIGATGNALLDSLQTVYAPYYGGDPRWGWDELDQVRELYAQAKPTVEHLDKFLNWAKGPDEMRQIAEIMLGITDENNADITAD